VCNLKNFMYICSKNLWTMEDEDKNSGKDRIRNKGQNRDGGRDKGAN